MTDILLLYRSDQTIRLNFEDVKDLDTDMVDKYDDWVDCAPVHWKLDGFLQNNSPIVVTSRFGQNALIAAPGNEDKEADIWNKQRDYSKIAFLTVAIATEIECVSFHVVYSCYRATSRCFRIEDWQDVPVPELLARHPGGLFDSPHPPSRRPVDLHVLPILADDGKEVQIFDSSGKRVIRRHAIIYDDEPPCGVLIDLSNIQALFNPDPASQFPEDPSMLSGYDEPDSVTVDAYPLGFLGTAGNIQAKGIPHCFYPAVADINRSVRKPTSRRSRRNILLFGDEDDNHPSLSTDMDEPGDPSTLQAVKPVASQFYNYMTHRVATRAGRLDSEQGSVTAAVSGAFVTSQKDKNTAWRKKTYCDEDLPSKRFHDRISIESCPISCRAELVYSVDVRALKDPSGSYVFSSLPSSSPFPSRNIIHRLDPYIRM